MAYPITAPRLSTLSRFLVVGGSGVLVNTCALVLLHQLIGLPLVIASALSVELAIANNYAWNDRWTFGQTRLSLARFVKFNVASIAGLLLTTATAWLLVHQAGMNYLLANLVGISLAAMCNFVASARWTWRSQGQANRDAGAAALFAVDPQSTVMGLDGLRNTGEPESRTVDLADVAAASKWLEDEREISVGNPDSPVAHTHDRPTSLSI
jgi:putative flippase GtrA